MNATSNVATNVSANVFSEVHILHILRLLNKHCFKRMPLTLKKDAVEEKKQLVQCTAKGVISETFEELLRRICVSQGADYVRVQRENRLSAGFKEFVPYYVIEILMPRLNSAIDPTKAMMIGPNDLFTVAAAQELTLEQPDRDDEDNEPSFTFATEIKRTLQ